MAKNLATDNVRKAAILAVLAAILVAMLGGTAGAKGGKVKTKTCNFKGTVTAVAEDGSSVSVEVTGGNKAAREAAKGREQPMVFPVSGSTKVGIDGQDAAVTDVVVGDPVKVQSKAPEDADEFPARKISVEHDEQEED